MTVAVSIVSRHKMKGQRVNLVDVTFSGDYPSNGEEITAAACGLTRIDHVDLVPEVGGYVPAWDRSAGKLLFYVSDLDLLADGPLQELANASYPSGITDNDPLRIRVSGV